jgi:hypothetical protein
MHRKRTPQYTRYSSHPISDRRRSQSLGRQRQFTAPSSKGMPNLDSTAPELTLSSHQDADRDLETNPYQNLEDLNGFHDYITSSKCHRPSLASDAANLFNSRNCHYTNIDYKNCSSSISPNPLDKSFYYETNDVNHRSSPIFFPESSGRTSGNTTSRSCSVVQANNSDLLLQQHQIIAPTAERRDQHNDRMTFLDSAHAGSSIKEVRHYSSKSKSIKHDRKCFPPKSGPASSIQQTLFVGTPNST